VTSQRLRVAGFLLIAGMTLTGCRPQGTPAPAPTATPSPAAIVTPAGTRVGVVDLDAIVRAHRRWPELAALLKKIGDVQARLSSPPPPPDAPKVTEVNLQAEADRLQNAMRMELDAIHAQMTRNLDAYANDLRADQEGKLADRQRQLNAQIQQAVETKRDELQRDFEKFELATMAEYRIPLANIRIKGDVVGVTNEEEAKKLNAEADRIAKERDEKIKARSDELEKALEEFQKAQNASAEEEFTALAKALDDEAKAKLAAKRDEANAQMNAEVQSRQEAIRAAMEARRKMVESGVQDQYRAAQERYMKQVQAEDARLQTELQALMGQRARLEDSMLAEVRIEVASAAQAQRVDVVLTRVVARTDAVDLTPAVIAKLKR
jgi:Skp family chaperone for outer membrane proteins